MKTKWILLVAAAGFMVMPTVASSLFEDDIYFDPRTDVDHPAVQKKETPREQAVLRSTPIPATAPGGVIRVNDPTGTVKVYKIRDVDEYNRRMTAQYREGYTEEAVSDSALETEPFEYSERIRRFHNPSFVTHITDGEYLDIYLEDEVNLTLNYYDERYRWMSPYYYDNYYYGLWYNDPYYSYYSPWYRDPWYYGYYSGFYGYSYWNSPWYFGYNYYGYPYYWGYNDYTWYDYRWYGGHSESRSGLSRSQRDFVYGDSRTAASRPAGSTTTRTPRTSSADVSSRAAGVSYGQGRMGSTRDVTAQPNAGRSGSVQPNVGRSGSAQPNTGRSSSVQPGTVRTITVPSNTGRSSTIQAGSVRQPVTRPTGTTTPGVSTPAVSSPGVSIPVYTTPQVTRSGVGSSTNRTSYPITVNPGSRSSSSGTDYSSSSSSSYSSPSSVSSTRSESSSSSSSSSGGSRSGSSNPVNTGRR